MTIRTISHDGNDVPRRLADKPVLYSVTLQVLLNADQRAEFEGTDEVILRHPTKPALLRAKVVNLEVS